MSLPKKKKHTDYKRQYFEQRLYIIHLNTNRSDYCKKEKQIWITKKRQIKPHMTRWAITAINVVHWIQSNTKQATCYVWHDSITRNGMEHDKGIMKDAWYTAIIKRPVNVDSSLWRACWLCRIHCIHYLFFCFLVFKRPLLLSKQQDNTILTYTGNNASYKTDRQPDTYSNLEQTHNYTMPIMTFIQDFEVRRTAICGF